MISQIIFKFILVISPYVLAHVRKHRLNIFGPKRTGTTLFCCRAADEKSLFCSTCVHLSSAPSLWNVHDMLAGPAKFSFKKRKGNFSTLNLDFPTSFLHIL